MFPALTRRLVESQPWLERVADQAQPVVRDLLGRRRRLRDLLDGTWLGAPLHPALTDVPIGAWVSAFALDTAADLSGSPAAARAADAALTVGAVSALPAALTGVSDWRDLSGQARRIATFHGLLNAVGLALTIASLTQRIRGRRGSGRALSASGLAFAGVAAHLGGELSFGLAVRVNRSGFVVCTTPADFTPVLNETELPAGEAMRTIDLTGTPVLLTRDRSGQPCAIANTCSHFGGPLASGQRTGEVVTCPWHGSRFNVRTGRVVEGPAVFPQPAYEVRVRNGVIELRRPRDAHRSPIRKKSGEGEQAVSDEQPSFERDIRPLFRPKDIESMSNAFDLSSYQDVRSNAEKIYHRLSNGTMPCDKPWPAKQVQQFHAWIEADYPR